MLGRLGRVKNLLRSSKVTGELIPLQREDAMLATHPSDHNAFYIGADADVLRETRHREDRETAETGCQERAATSSPRAAFLAPAGYLLRSCCWGYYQGWIHQ